MNKYRNKPTTALGIKFASAAEAARYVFLHRLSMAGEIQHLECQVPIVLAPSVFLRGAKRKTPALRYFADFRYVDQHGQCVLEDVKGGPSTAVFKLKRHLLAVQGIFIHEIRS